MLSAVEPAAESAKFDNDPNPDIRLIRYELTSAIRLLERIHKWLMQNHPGDFPDFLGELTNDNGDGSAIDS